METYLEQAREIPIVEEADVVICGAGPAGVCTAVAAAQSGARVWLLELRCS
jgi:flavin-dependent dehydrogenase